jgi:hypothetical protein
VLFRSSNDVMLYDLLIYHPMRKGSKMMHYYSEMLQQKTVMAYFTVGLLSRTFPAEIGKLRKNSVRVDGRSDLTEALLNTKHE